MINFDEWKDKQFSDLLIEIVDTLNKHERYLESLQEAIIMSGKTSKLFIDAFKEREEKNDD